MEADVTMLYHLRSNKITCLSLGHHLLFSRALLCSLLKGQLVVSWTSVWALVEIPGFWPVDVEALGYASLQIEVLTQDSSAEDTPCHYCNSQGSSKLDSPDVNQACLTILHRTEYPSLLCRRIKGTLAIACVFVITQSVLLQSAVGKSR